MLQRDNVVAADADGLAALGIAPTPLAAVAPALAGALSAATAGSARRAARRGLTRPRIDAIS